MSNAPEQEHRMPASPPAVFESVWANFAALLAVLLLVGLWLVWEATR